MDGIEELTGLLKSETIKRTVNNYYLRLDNRLSQYLAKKVKLIVNIIVSRDRWFTMLLINLIPLAYFYGKSCELENSSLWYVFKNEFHVLLPFTIVSLSLQKISCFLGKVFNYLAVTLGVFLAIYLFFKILAKSFKSDEKESI